MIKNADSIKPKISYIKRADLRPRKGAVCQKKNNTNNVTEDNIKKNFDKNKTIKRHKTECIMKIKQIFEKSIESEVIDQLKTQRNSSKYLLNKLEENKMKSNN